MARRPSNRRALVALLGAMLLVLWGFVGLWSWTQRRDALAAADAILEKLAAAVEEQTFRLFRQTETSLAAGLHWMAEHPDRDPASDRSFNALVDRLRILSDGFLDLRLVDRSGGLQYVPRRSEKALADVSDRDYFKAQMDPATRGFYIAAPVISRVTGKWGIPISMPAETAGGDVAVLFAAIELDRIAKTFETERLKPDGSILLLRADGTILFRTPEMESMGKSMAETSTYRQYYSQMPRGKFVTDGKFFDGRPRMVAFQRLADYPLIVVVTAGLDDVLAPWRRETAILAGVAVVITAAFALLARILLQSMKAEERSRRTSEQARREAELILAAAGEGICGLDAQGRVTFMNPAARAMLGWEADTPIGVDLHTTNHHSRADGTPYPPDECPISRTLADGQTREIADEHFIRLDGTLVPVEMIVTPLREGDQVTGAVMVFRDISERLEAERAMIVQATELARSNADLEQFAYIASHDLREPLRQVASFVSLLERRYGPQLDSTAKDYIAYARDGAKRMDRLMIDLLEFSRIGHRALPVERINLDQVVDEAVANLKPAIAEAGAEVLRPAHLPVLTVVRDDMVRLFQNLIGNAIKYRRPDQPPVIRIEATTTEDCWEISVADNGIGIDPQYADRIFGIFQRLHTRDQYEGTGIGLAIVKKIVERAGGSIAVESAPGQGSTFRIRLPAA